MAKETVETLTKKYNALLDLIIADQERKEGEGKNVPMLGELYKIAGREPEKED